ncbi:hypothetical protein [Nocardiopsis sp. NPDC057823]|uniref:hypothetical protein n=1 Tax=Nocardiopsis sp. NPDC057823 TaxID=3346256 RepID=UPI00366C474F
MRAARDLAAVDPTMTSLLGLIPWADVGIAGALLAVVVYGLYLLATGRLIPAATHERIVAGRDEQLKQMRELYESERKRADLYATQAAAGTEAARTAAASLDALRTIVETPEEGDVR